MKVIDLLNKIANGEEVPKEIKYNNIEYLWCNQCKIYERLEDAGKDLYNDLDNLNDEVEILEEKKKIPEQINKSYNIRILDLDKPHIIKDYDMEQLIEMVQDIYDKQADIIDCLNSKGE